MRVKLIALGNTLMKDDGIGIYVVKKIEEKLSSLGIGVLYGETDINYVISQVKDNDYILIVDAGQFGKNIGDITTMSLEEYRTCKPDISQHKSSFLDIQKIYFPHLCGRIYAIEVSEITYDMSLSDLLKNKLNEISEELYQIIEKNYRKVS